jgi:septum formation protein
MSILYLASQSKSRKKLLDTANIPYQVITHSSDECGIELTESFEKYVLAIAQHKMDHAIIPPPKELPVHSKSIIVLTADTLMRTEKTKIIMGKPKNIDDAKKMLQLACQEPLELVTACCLDKKEFRKDSWITIEKKHWTATAKLEFCVEQDSVQTYLEKVPDAMFACGAGVIEGFGLNFLKSMNGSFSAIMGLPLFELRVALKELS